MKAKERIRRYIKHYKFNSLFIKNLLLLLALIMIPLTGTTILAYYAYGNLRKNEVRAYHESVTADAYAKLERILKEARSELIYIGFNSNVELYMYDTEEVKQLNYQIASIQDIIKLPVLARDYITSIYVYSRKSGKVVSIWGLSDYDTFGDKGCLEPYLESEEERRNIMITTGTDAGYPKRQLSIFQEINYGSKSTGVSVMNVDIKLLEKEAAVPDGIRLYLTDGQDILFSNDDELIGEKAERIPGYCNIVSNGIYQNGEYTVSSKLAEASGLEVITYMELNGYHSQLSAVKDFMIIFLSVMVLITLGLSALISVRIFRPIEEIITTLRKYHDVLLGEEELFQEKDELEYILQSIQKTVNIKKDVDEELSERVRLLKKAQAVALQSQINPHFLNNTLDTINWMAIGLLGGRNEISEMTGALSRMLRMTLENTDTIVPVRAEVEHCMYYLEIQKKRYEDKFIVVWQIPEEVKECRTIRVILQPIVENAIYHGVKPLSNQGVITIGGRICGGEVELTVEDNGLGMTKEELDELQADMRSSVIKESRHIGVPNVNQRLRLYFGEEYGVFIDSAEGAGTRVTVRFPKIETL